MVCDVPGAVGAGRPVVIDAPSLQLVKGAVEYFTRYEVTGPEALLPASSAGAVQLKLTEPSTVPEAAVKPVTSPGASASRPKTWMASISIQPRLAIWKRIVCTPASQTGLVQVACELI